MLDKLTNQLDFHAKGLLLRSERQRTIASNIANADTPGYAARDFSFADAMQAATGGGTSGTRLAATALAPSAGDGGKGFIPLSGIGSGGSALSGIAQSYVTQTQPSMDGNSVDLDRERAAFADNAVRYEATLRFINGSAKTMLTAIQGQ